MSAAAKYQLAIAMADNHADGCPVCEPPSVERTVPGCATGRRLALAMAGAWRARIIALSDRGRP